MLFNINIGIFLHYVAWEVFKTEREIISFSMPVPQLNINFLSFRTAHSWRGEHIHDAVEIIYVTAGKLCAHINGTAISAGVGDIILINRDVTHYLENISQAEIIYIQIDLRKRFGLHGISNMYIYEFITQCSDKSYCKLHGKNELSDIFLAIEREISQKQQYYEMYVKAYTDLLAAFMLRRGFISDLDKPTLARLSSLLPLAKYIEENYAEPIALSDCAAVCGYSKYELCRRFKLITGKTLTNYLNYVRTENAKRLMREGKNVTEAALECGFSSVQYFNKSFKKLNGCTPGKYSRQID